MLAKKGGFIGKNEEYGIKKEQIIEVALACTARYHCFQSLLPYSQIWVDQEQPQDSNQSIGLCGSSTRANLESSKQAFLIGYCLILKLAYIP